jgi:hypothetical protein
MSRPWVLPLCGAVAGCASVIGVPNDTPSFCAQNQGHDYCEDFDVGDPAARWSYVVTKGGAQWAIKPSDDSPPNLIDLSAPAIPADGGVALAGFDKEFMPGFHGLHIEADVRFVTQRDAGFVGQIGVLIITDKEGGCLAVAAVPGGLGVVNLVTPLECSALTNGSTGMMMMGPPTDAGGPDGGAFTGSPLGPLPPPNQWFHMVIDVKPDPSGDGSGTFIMNIVGQPTGYMPAPIKKMTLVSSGAPLVGFSNTPQPGTTIATEVQYDNVTIDLKSH